jgi:dihydroflavonol-4-reductase
VKCFVTGASGFIGSNLVHELVARGHHVRALIRPEADLRGLEGAKFDRVDANLLDRAELKAAMTGCDWCFHVAASYALWMRDYEEMEAVNVDGSRAVLMAASEAGCSRIVHTSTVGCIGLPRARKGKLVPSDERAIAPWTSMRNPYKRSKYRAEDIARSLADRGAPVVIVNPSAPIGPRDVKPTPTGKIVLDFLNRELPAYLDTGLNWVHVRDVAIGHILAAEKGRIGERYILGNQDGNWTMKAALATLAEITGLPAPRFKVPFRIALLAAHFDELRSKFTRRPPKAPLAGVRMARYKMYFTPAKAIAELGLPQTPPRQAFVDAVDWFRSHGYVRTAK